MTPVDPLTLPGGASAAGGRQGPLAVVFGASRGLGLAIAHQLGARGHRLVITARDAAELDRARHQLADRGYDVTAHAGDIGYAAGVQTTVEHIEANLGPIEVAIVVAGIIGVGPLADQRRVDFEQAIDVMLWGPINAALAVLPGMRERGRGRIGIVSSIGGLVSAPHLLPYCTAKFGAVGFARGLRAELTGSGVSVTAITPGLMRTGSHVRARFQGQRGREYAWFATAASLPLLSADADRAAATIVDRTLRGRSTVLITPLAQVAARVAGLTPTGTAAVLGLTARLLPQPAGDGGGPEDGFEAREAVRGRARTVLDRLTTLNDRASRRLLQHRHRSAD